MDYTWEMLDEIYGKEYRQRGPEQYEASLTPHTFDVKLALYDTLMTTEFRVKRVEREGEPWSNTINTRDPPFICEAGWFSIYCLWAQRTAELRFGDD